MKPLFFFLCLCLIPLIISAQLQDDFSDGDFSNNPEWQGNTDQFTVTNQELQLNNPNPESNNTSFLYVNAATSSEENTQWDFLVRLNFAPSASNFPRVYLSASNADLTGPQDGYFLKIGGISGTDDALELFRQDGNSTSLLLSGQVGAVGSSPINTRIRVTRSASGEWELLADYSGGTNFISEGTATDSTFPNGKFFGFYCQYTATRNDAFFFDDVVINPLFVDTTPPLFLSATAVSNNTIELQFDEFLNAASAELANNYLIDNGIGIPSNANLKAEDPSTVTLTLSTPLINQQDYSVTTNNIEDIAGNSSNTQTQSFTFLDIQEPTLGDLLITEFMADPNPPVGLPEAEYVELYNQSDKIIQLENIGFSSGGSPRALPAFLLFPNQYVLITDSDFTSAFQTFGDVLGISSFPALSNGGDEISLSSSDGNPLATIIYNDSWYRNSEKEDGGYALELIQLDGPIQCAGNWIASLSPNGGTPGQANSTSLENQDMIGPSLLSATVESNTELRLIFSKDLDEDEAINPDNYSLDNNLQILEILLQSPNNTEVLLVLDNPLVPQTLYNLSLSTALSDCLGNLLEGDTESQIAITELPDFEKVIISEIMAAPNNTTGLVNAEYIELFNNSEKFIQLADLQYINGNAIINLPRKLLLPGAYLTICDDDFRNSFTPFGDVVSLSSFPTLTNAGEELRLQTRNSTLIFSVNYLDDWYQDPIREGGGWSLELIDLSGPFDCGNNWRASISNNPEGGTPGFENAVLGQSPDLTPPNLLLAIPKGAEELVLTFDGEISPSSAQTLSNFSIDQGINVISSTLLLPEKRKITLRLGQPLQAGLIYTITIGSSFTNCLGTPIGLTNALQFGLPEPAAPNDIIINEVLFFPESGSKDFVELYNRSNKILNLSGMVIENELKFTGDTLQTIKNDYLLFPNEYAVLTEDPGDINFRYVVQTPSALIENGLPTLDSDFGNVTLRSVSDIETITIDSFDYSDDFHFELLSDKRGVSLERLDPNATTNDPGNWHSAAQSVGFATPSFQNSQFFTIPSVLDEMISLPITTFSPDNDGFEDLLLIQYQTNQSGYTLNIRIYDANGRLVKKLVNNELLAAQGTIKWDGSTEEESKARIGIYVVWIELFDLNGLVERMKKVAVVAGKLN